MTLFEHDTKWETKETNKNAEKRASENWNSEMKRTAAAEIYRRSYTNNDDDDDDNNKSTIYNRLNGEKTNKTSSRSLYLNLLFAAFVSLCVCVPEKQTKYLLNSCFIFY